MSSVLDSLAKEKGLTFKSEVCIAKYLSDVIQRAKTASKKPVLLYFAKGDELPEALHEIEERYVFILRNENSEISGDFDDYRQYVFPKIEEANSDRLFWRLLNDLVLDLSYTLLHADSDGSLPSTFLAPVPSGMEPLKNRVRRDVESRGFGVHTSTDDIEKILATSTLSVHLFGDGASLNTASGKYSIDVFRKALGFARTHPEFHILGWIDASANETALLNEQILREANDIGSAGEIMQSAIEDFKSVLYDRFQSPTSISRSESTQRDPTTTAPTTHFASDVSIYVIYDPRDVEAAGPIKNFLQGQGVDVLVPEFPTDQAKLRAIHNENLRRCDAALIVYGAVQEQWVRMKQQDLLRASALGRKKNLAAKGVFLCSAKTENKLRFQAADMTVIKGFESPTELTPFLQRLTAQ